MALDNVIKANLSFNKQDGLKLYLLLLLLFFVDKKQAGRTETRSGWTKRKVIFAFMNSFFTHSKKVSQIKMLADHL